jgi:hypothetical protein
LIKSFDILLEKDEVDQKALNDITQTFINLRIYSINIVNHFIKLRETSSFGVIGGKYDLDNISETYSYDRNYLLKMKNDTDFLHNSNLRRFYNFSMDSDPFLVSISDNKSGGKSIIPLTDEMLLLIRNSQFILLQELIYYEVSRMNGASKNVSNGRKRELKPLSIGKSPDIGNMTMSRIKPTSQHLRRDVSNTRTNHKELLSKELNELSVDNARAEHLEKARKYDLNNINLRGELLQPAQLVADTSIISIKSKNMGQKPMLTDESRTYLQTDYENTHKYLKTEISGVRLNTDCDIVETKVASKPEIIATKPLPELVTNTHHTIKADKEPPAGVLDKIKQRYKDFVQGREVQKEPTIPLAKEVVVKETKNKDITFSVEPTPATIITELPNEQIEVKEEKDNFDISKLTFKFFTDKISRFDKIFKHYVSQLDEEQRTIFKISNKLIDHLRGISPKLIQINYNKVLCGFAAVSYNPSDTNVKLTLSHFSTTYFKHYQTILTDLIEFLKQNFKFNELHLELYYGTKDGKPYMNQQISDIVSKKIKFKWVTLENSGIERKVKYKLPNVKETIDLGMEAFRLQFVVVLALEDKSKSPESIRYIDKENDINLFPFLYVLSEMSNQHGYNITTADFAKLNTDNLRVSIGSLYLGIGIRVY